MKFKEKNIPIIYLEIDKDGNETGVDTISFVDRPAVEIEWHLFNDKLKFAKDDKKRIVTSVVMLAETPIFRQSETLGEYFVKFSEDTVLNMMMKYFKDNKINRVNENHNPDRMVDNVIMVESFIVGDRIESKIFKDIPSGSWIASFYIADEDYWNDVILSDAFSGFSLEGSFEEKFEDELVEKIYDDVLAILNSDDLTDEEKEIKIKEII